ncbi:kinase-like domain-containing protein [Xylariaceae sp. FL1651]|nr:kinase-like domain-containing protein [Xylariaceae sp. FL1651]
MTRPTQTTVLFSEPASQLPEPLPSVDEIESSPHVLKRLSARCAVRVREHFVVKYDTEVEPVQGENMIFVREHLKKLDHDHRSPHIIMKYIHGCTLEEAWDTMDEPERLKHTAPGYPGGLGITKLNDVLFWTREPTNTMNRPFNTEAELVHGMVQQFRAGSSEVLRHEADYDFQRKNIMVGSGGEIAVIDWASSERYPTYWEYASAMLPCCGWKDVWHCYIAKFWTSFPNQFAWLHILHVENVGGRTLK